LKSNEIPAELPIALDEVCSLSLECWRLRRVAEQVGETSAGLGLRYAIRRITDTLGKTGIEVLDFAGRTYDAGMVPEVVEVREDHALPHGNAVIEETIAPTVTWRGHVVSPGQIIVRRSAVRPEESTEVLE